MLTLLVPGVGMGGGGFVAQVRATVTGSVAVATSVTGSARAKTTVTGSVS